MTFGDHKQGGTKPHMFVQTTAGKFEEVVIPTSKWLRNGRVANITLDARPDLIVVEGGKRSRKYFQPFLHIYKGINHSPYFDFSRPYYTRKLPNAAYDLEVLDVNQDSNLDIYISQANESSGYCSGKRSMCY